MSKKVFNGYVCNSLKMSDLKNLYCVDNHVCLSMKCAKEAWGGKYADSSLWPPKRVIVTIEIED